MTLDHDFHAHLALAKSDAPSVILVRLEGLDSVQQADLIRRVLGIMRGGHHRRRGRLCGSSGRSASTNPFEVRRSGVDAIPALLSEVQHRVGDFHTAYSAEVAIGGPQLTDSVYPADRRNPRVMNLGSGDLALPQDFRKCPPVCARLADQFENRRFEPDLDLTYCHFERSRRLEDSGMRDEGYKFMQAGPWNCPMFRALSQAANGGRRTLKEFRIAPMGIYQDICVDRDHAPRP